MPRERDAPDEAGKVIIFYWLLWDIFKDKRRHKTRFLYYYARHAFTTPFLPSRLRYAMPLTGFREMRFSRDIFFLQAVRPRHAFRPVRLHAPTLTPSSFSSSSDALAVSFREEARLSPSAAFFPFLRPFHFRRALWYMFYERCLAAPGQKEKDIEAAKRFLQSDGGERW